MKIKREMKKRISMRITRIEAELDKLEVGTEEYNRGVSAMKEAILAREALDKIDWNKLIPVLINAALLIPMIWYSKHDILDSKMGVFLKNWLRF